MDVLVIGGTGLLSDAIVDALVRDGHHVTTFTRGVSPARALKTVHALHGDRQDRAAFRAAFVDTTYDAVIDCIAYTPEDIRSDLETFAGRIGHFLFISTDFVYGEEGRRLPVTEGYDAPALGDYGRLKRECERMLMQACRMTRFPATIFRPPHIYGPRALLGSGSLQGRDEYLPSLVRQGKPVILLDGGALLIQPVHRNDAAGGILSTLGNPQTFGRAYTLAGPECVTTRQYYEAIGAAAGREVVVASLPSSVYRQAYPDRAPFCLHRMYDLSRLQADTGWQPGISVREAIAETLGWLDANGRAPRYEGRALDERVLGLLQASEQELIRALQEPA